MPDSTTTARRARAVFAASHPEAEIKGCVELIQNRHFELRNHAMPAATALALIYAAVGLRERDRLLAPVDSDPAWLAAFVGGLTAGVVGALAEDSGPVLLVVAVFALGCVATYLWGAPPTPRSPGSSRAARSRARTPPAALSR